jgi:hypothetical protein
MSNRDYNMTALWLDVTAATLTLGLATTLRPLRLAARTV